MTDMPLSDADSDLVERAHRFAAAAHQGQLRKGRLGAPYIVHPIEVMEVLLQAGIADPAILAGALLHDTVEDTATTGEQIAALFGATVASIVDETTDPQGLSRAERRRHQVETLPGKSAACQYIKVGDKISNLRTILRDPPPEWGADRKIEYLVFSDQVVAACDKVAPALLAIYAAVRTEFVIQVPGAG